MEVFTNTISYFFYEAHWNHQMRICCSKMKELCLGSPTFHVVIILYFLNHESWHVWHDVPLIGRFDGDSLLILQSFFNELFSFLGAKDLFIFSSRDTHHNTCMLVLHAAYQFAMNQCTSPFFQDTSSRPIVMSMSISIVVNWMVNIYIPFSYYAKLFLIN